LLLAAKPTLPVVKRLLPSEVHEYAQQQYNLSVAGGVRNSATVAKNLRFWRSA
jgi:hypothetical protein